MGLTNLILHEIEVPDYVYKDSLKTEYNSISAKDKVDVILANPSLAEQKAIVEKIESLMQQVSAMEEEIQNSEQNAQMLMQAVLKEAFKDKKEVV